MKVKDREIAPLIKGFILIGQINARQNVNNSLFELKKMCEIYGDEFTKNINLISFNQFDFKNFENNEKKLESFFIQNFPELIENENFIKIFGNLLMDAKNEYSISEIFHALNNEYNLNIENQMKLIISFIDSGVNKYLMEGNILFLEKCKEIYENKLFFEFKNNIIVEKIINILFNILKIKNIKNSDDKKENQNDVEEENIKVYIQSFSFCNQQLKANLLNKENSINKEKVSQSSKKEINESNINISNLNNKIKIEKLLYELGPLLANQNINLSNIPYIDTNLDIYRLSEFILYILKNPEIPFTKDIKFLNKIFWEAIDINPEYINLIDSIPNNKLIAWDINSLSNLFQNSLINIDKLKLLNLLDCPSFNIDNKIKYDFLSEILIKFHFFGDNLNINNIQLYFENLIFKKWKNIPNQIKFLELLITNKEISENSIFSLKNYQGQKIRRDIELKAYTSSKNHYLIENWRNIKLIETLLIISEGDNYETVKKLFDWSLKNIPEIIIMALLNIKIDYNKNPLMSDLILEILSQILNDKNPRLKLIDEIWQTNKDIVIFTLYNSWKNSPDLMNLSQIFDLSNSLLKDSILPLVNSKYHNFSIHLGLLASKRDYLHIEQWLRKSIEKYGDDFIKVLLDYLKINIIMPCQINLNQKENSKASILEKAQLSLESLSIILNTLNTYNTNDNTTDKISPKIKKEIEEINKIIFDIYDEIQDQQINSEEIEKEVSQLLRNMLDEKIPIDKIINLLIKYKSSNDKKQNEIFSCLIHGLLDEYRFYKQYPKKKLEMISELFGKIINNKLLYGIIETLALKYILEGIKSDSDLLCFFGINALTQFLGKISHWPSYMKTLLNLEQIKQNKEIYMRILEENEKSQKKNASEKSAENSDKFIPLISISQSENKSIEDNYNKSNTSVNNENINSINKIKDTKQNEIENVDKLKNKLSGVTKSFIDYDYNNYKNNSDDQKIEVPIEEIINETKFIFDTLNKSNIYEKSLEIINLLGNDEKKIRWFSYYFITSRINHSKNIPFRIFYELFNQINHPILLKYILKDTIKYIQELLALEFLFIDDKCKNILKNLGTWLGYNTLPKNKPILAKDIDFRELITNSYKKGELSIIIPFTCRVFSFITKSKIFNINNPWINSILSLLKEIYHKSLLSFALKKEIETFFEGIKIEMSSLSNSTKYLTKIKRLDSKNHDFPDSQKYQINIDLNELTQKISSLHDYINNLVNIFLSDKNAVSGLYYNNKNFNYLNDLNENECGDNEDNLSNSNNKNLENQKEVINILTNIMNKSILESIPDLISLYCENPINSAIALVNKDFTFEMDVNKYKTALDNTLQFLLNSFSIFGAHDKLKNKIDSNLEKYYKAKKFEKETINKIKNLPNNEYINIGLEIIQKFIMKEAKNKLSSNKQVLEEIDKRKKGNLNLSKNDFYKDYIAKIKGKMPEILKPNEQHIKDNEFKIYENFKKNGFKLFEEDTNKSSFLNTVYRILKEVIDKASIDNSPNKNSTYKNYDLCMKNIQNISIKNNFGIYEENEKFICLKKIIEESKINQEEVSTKLASITFNYIMNSIKINNPLLVNAYIYILKGWAKLNNEIYNKITIGLFEYDTDIFTKFKYELHFYLIRQKLINHQLYENYMITLLNGPVINNLIIKLLNQLSLNHIIGNNQKIKSYYYDKNSKKYYLLFNKRTSVLSHLYNNFLNFKIMGNYSDDAQFERKNNSVLNFVNVIQKFYKTLNSLENDFEVNEIQTNENIYVLDDALNFFNEISFLCLNKIYEESFIEYINFFYPENLAIFIFHYFKNIVNNEEKILFLNKSLFSIINIFHQDYVSNQINFNQKKYYKLLLNLIYLITNSNNNLNSQNQEIDYLFLICDALKILSPNNYPGFILAWIDLISYNKFISNFLDTDLIKENSNIKYEKYLSLIVELLAYINTLKNKIINYYYLKVILDKIYQFFLIISNTYSEFICSYSYILLSYLSLSSSPKDEDNNAFLQLKNIILSAYPSDFALEENKDKKINTKYYENKSLNIKIFEENLISKKLAYLFFGNDNNENKNKEEFQLNQLLNNLDNDNNIENNLELILNYLDNIKEERELYSVYNGIMLYWSNKEKFDKNKKIFYEFYYFLLCNLNEIHKKYLIDSILNALRFPSSQTIEYSELFQKLLINLENEDIEEQLIVNILERMIYKPIPWGIKYTLNCLFNNKKYQQIEKKFIALNNELMDFINKISINLTDTDDLKNCL